MRLLDSAARVARRIEKAARIQAMVSSHPHDDEEPDPVEIRASDHVTFLSPSNAPRTCSLFCPEPAVGYLHAEGVEGTESGFRCQDHLVDEPLAWRDP